MKHLVYASLLLVAALSFAPASSQAASPETVHRYFEVIGASQLADRVISILHSRLAAQMKQVYTGPTPDEEEIIPQMFDDARPRMIQAVQEAMEKIYADTFTDSEIIAAIKFHRSPEGRSVLHKQREGAEETAMGRDNIIHLTDAEATAMANFYQSPQGQSFVKKLEPITQQSPQIAQAALAPFIPELQQRLKDELEKRHPDQDH